MATDEFSEYPDTGAEGAGEHSHPQDESIWFTNKNNYNEYEPPRPDADYGVGASGSVSVAARQGSGGGSSAPFIHPFKLEKVTDPEDPNSTKVRVYAGDVFAKIDTFQLGIVTVTTGASHTHSPGNYLLPEHQHEGYNDSSSTGLTIPTHTHTQGGTAAAKEGDDITEGDTESGDDHTHATTGMSVTMADHYHKSGEESGTGTTAEGQQLKLRHHTHSLPNTTGGPTSGSGAGSGGAYTGADASHTHDLGGSTGDVDNFGVDDSGSLAPEDITGNTGGLDHTFPAQQFSGTISNESSHKHKYNKDDHSHTLSGQTGGVHDHSTAANKKVAGNTADVVPQSGSLPPITGTSGTSSSSTTVHKFVVITGQSKAPNPTATNWAATFNKAVKADDGTDTLFKYHESANANGEFYVKWVITINDAAEVQTVVGSIDRVAVGAARPADDPFGALTQNADAELSRGQLTGTFYQKIGKVDTNTIEQDQFSNINWSMTVLPEVS